MKKIILIAGLLLVSAAAQASNCEEIKGQIADKITANGVANFTLTIVDKGNVTDQKVVGSCDNSRKEIVYVRGDAKASQPTQAATESAAGDVIATPTETKPAQ